MAKSEYHKFESVFIFKRPFAFVMQQYKCFRVFPIIIYFASSGAKHSIEMSYVWGLPKLFRNSLVTADIGMYAAAAGGWTQEDITYADFIIGLWTNFAKYGFVKLRHHTGNNATGRTAETACMSTRANDYNRNKPCSSRLMKSFDALPNPAVFD